MNRHLFRYHIVSLGAAFLMCAFLTQCGGLTQRDFEKVNISGFDAEDQEIDHNDYAYSMEYFKADDAEDGYLYVGTCNNMGGLIGFYVQMMRDGGDILDAPICPPEIRRYRPDLGALEWETVLDYRDVEEEGNFKTIGFRFMTILEAAELDKDAPPANFLYAATQGEMCDLWRSKTGNYGDWELVYTFEEFGGSIRWIEQFEGRMYLAIAYDSFGAAPPPGEIWVSDDGLNFRPIMRNGFGDPNNRGVQALIVYQDWLYAGTKNDIDGFDIWKLRPVTPGADEYECVRVVSGGGPSSHNENAGMPIVFQDKLYFGTQLYIGGVNPTSGNAFEGCDIIRINEDDSWDTIVGPRSLSGYASGFNHFTNSYLWWMEEHDHDRQPSPERLFRYGRFLPVHPRGRRHLQEPRRRKVVSSHDGRHGQPLELRLANHEILPGRVPVRRINQYHDWHRDLARQSARTRKNRGPIAPAIRLTCWKHGPRQKCTGRTDA